MGFNNTRPDKSSSSNAAAVFEMLDEDFDGYMIVGYCKGGHQKVFILRGEDPACKDGLNFFVPGVQIWQNLSGDNQEDEGEPSLE